MKRMLPLSHGVLDYLWAVTMISAPRLFGFRRDPTARASAMNAGAAMLGLSLLTRYPLGPVKWIPARVHAALEALVSLAALTAPWSLGFSRNRAATTVHVLAGVGGLMVISRTDYRVPGQTLIQALPNTTRAIRRALRRPGARYQPASRHLEPSAPGSDAIRASALPGEAVLFQG